VQVEGPIPELYVTSSQVPEGAPVVLAGSLESVSGGIVVTATVTAPYVGVCRRCLSTATGSMEAQVVELITDDPDPDTGYVIEGGKLDLLALAHDACILELPLAPICREDCAGLCPVCGANLNLEHCSCTLPVDPRWAGLAHLYQEELKEDLAGEPVDARPEEEDLQGQEP